MTDAIIGYGTLFQISNGASPPEWETVAEAVDFSLPPLARDSIDISVGNAPEEWREHIPGMKDGGEIVLNLNYSPESYTALQEEFSEGIKLRRILFPDGNSFEFYAFLTGLDNPIPISDRIITSAKFKVTGTPGLVAIPHTLESFVGLFPARYNMMVGARSALDSTQNFSLFSGLTGINVIDGVTSPDGTANAQYIQESTANLHKVQTLQPSQGSNVPLPYRLAAIVQAAGRTRIVMQFESGNFTNSVASVGFDLANGVVFDATAGSQVILSNITIRHLRNHWYLCYFDATFNTPTFNSNAVLWQNGIWLDKGSGSELRQIEYQADTTKGINLWWFNLLPVMLWDDWDVLFEDEFNDTSGIDLSNTRAPGYNWYLHNLMPNSSMPTFGWHTNPPSAPTNPTNISVSNGVLTLHNPLAGQNGFTSQMWSVADNGAGGIVGHYYRAPLIMEGLAAWSDIYPTGWAGLNATLWGASVEALINHNINPSTKFMEWDVYEGLNDRAGSTTHEWTRPAVGTSDGAGANEPSVFGTPFIVGTNSFQRMACVWLNTETTGTGWGHFLAFYNGVLLSNGMWTYTLASGKHTQIDGHHMPLFINTGEDTSGSPGVPGGGAEYNLKYVKVWGRTTPPTVYTYWNFHDKGNDLVLSFNALTITKPSEGSPVGWESVRAHIGRRTGKWYWEYTVEGGTMLSITDGIMLGIANHAAQVKETFPGNVSRSAGLRWNTAANAHVNGVTGDTPNAMQWNTGDIIGFAFDADAGKMYIHRNGDWLTGVPASGISVWSGLISANGPWYPTVAMNALGNAITANFGKTAFVMTVPGGFAPITADILQPSPPA